MKKQIVIIGIFSLLHSQLAASVYNQATFINNNFTQQDVDNHYKEFFEHTKNQAQLMWWFGRFGEGFITTMAATRYGYNDFAKRLVWLGNLILDNHWEKRLNEILINCRQEDLDYLNNTKSYVLNHMKSQYNTYNALNESIHLIHESHVAELQKRYNLSDDFTQQLRENSQKINGQYPMYHYLSEYKEHHDEKLPPMVVINMLLPYLFSLYKITPKGS